MMKWFRYGLLVGLFWLSLVVFAQQEIEDYVQAVTTDLQKQTGKKPEPEEIVDSLLQIGWNLYQKGDRRTALTVIEQAYQYTQKEFLSEHPTALAVTNALAFHYRDEGRYEEAEPLFQRALATRERVLGPKHPDTLLSVNNLAALYESQGRYGEAEPLFQRVLAASEQVLGPEHPDTLRSVNNLAFLYKSQGRYGVSAKKSTYLDVWNFCYFIFHGSNASQSSTVCA